MNRKNLLTRIGEAIDQYQTERQQGPSDDQATHPPTQRRRWAARLLPNPSTVIFTALVVAALLWAQSAGALTLGAPNAAAASTGTIAYQGRLADNSGNPLMQTVNMIFRLYAASSSGTPLWEEQWTGPNSVQVSDGLFNVMLGSLTPIPQAVVTANPNLFLGITVGTDSEMSPRVQLGSVPFAVQALTVPDGSITTAKIDDGAVTQAKLAEEFTSDNIRFETQTVQLGSFSTSSTTFVDIPSSTITVNVAKPSTLLVSFSGSIWTMLQANGSAGALLTISVDGMDRTDLVTQDLSTWSGACCTPNAAIMPAGFAVLVPIESGSHILKVRVLSSSFDPNSRAAGIGYNGRLSSFSVIVLGR